MPEKAVWSIRDRWHKYSRLEMNSHMTIHLKTWVEEEHNLNLGSSIYLDRIPIDGVRRKMFLYV